ncbi:HAMP domain-containing sensor histidine kinase [Actinocorallia lasiicapitis]
MGMRLRATLVATVTVAVALVLAAVSLFAALESSLKQSAENLASDNVTTATASLDGAPTTLQSEVGPDGGTVITHSGGDLQILNGTGADGSWTSNDDYTVTSQTVNYGHGELTVQGRASLAPAKAAMATLRELLIPGIPALLLLVALLTWTVVGRVLRPVSAIRAKVADITTRDLHERVPEPRSRDEIARLARTVNTTLDRLQTAVEAHKQFVADAAHELRSPLAVLRTRLELARPEEEHLAGQALTDVVRLQTLTTDLLLLSRLDAHEPVQAQEVDFSQVVAEEAARNRPRPDVKVALTIAPDVLVLGSSDQLRRLVANLVDNAVRHASSHVDVQLRHDPGHAILEVTDDGPGIPEEHWETIFDRFTRLDHARTRDAGGAGLGLSIARTITTAHSGTLHPTPTPTGARLRATLPVP